MSCKCESNMPKLPDLPEMPSLPSMLDLSVLSKLADLGIAIPKNLLSHPLVKIDKPLLPAFKGFPDCNCPPDCSCRTAMNPKYNAKNEKTYSDKSSS